MYNKGILYDTFNAKYLSYQEVASSFIPNDEFHQILGNNHTLLMGPRGCGKTTLLKMLTFTALKYWDNPLANEVLDKMPFTAVYIPTDIQWKNQLDYLDKHLKERSEFNERISEFLVITNAQVHLCRTFDALLRGNELDRATQFVMEEKITTELGKAWEIEIFDFPSFENIETELLKRVYHINREIVKIIYHNRHEVLYSDLPNYVYVDFLSTMTIGCQIFERYFPLKKGTRWALCFDELEIAPKFFQRKLFSYLRSIDQKFIFKLTTTPIVNVESDETEATQDDDFKAVRLWVYDDSGATKWDKFCDTLVSNRLNRSLKNESKLTPENVLGSYDVNDIIQRELRIKGKPISGAFAGSVDNVLFKTLASKDDKFREYLIHRGIDPENPVAKNFTENKSVFQKHKLNALYRIIFKDKTRKSPPIHYGIPHIYDLCDGNPRAIVRLIDDLLVSISINSNEALTISARKQSEILLNASKKYFTIVKNHPDSTIMLGTRQFNLATQILKKIGGYVYHKMVKDSFNVTVPTTFTIDHPADSKILKLLEHALYLGAIIYLDPVESLSKTGLLNKRFRLSYMLAPLFRTPNRTDHTISLNTILKEDQIQLGFEFDIENDEYEY